ncbi:MAG TPA: fibronectin type III domain-containing protein [Thermoanaerobaculia bacterium]|jgi:hypothetical protein
MTTRLARAVVAFVLVLISLSLAAAGRPLAPRPLGPSSYLPDAPVSAYAGGRFLTIWNEYMGLHGRHLMGALSDANGVKISPRSFFVDVTPFGSYQLFGAGESFALFSRDGVGGPVQMTDIDREGRVTGRRTLALPLHQDARFSWNGTHFLAILYFPGASNTSMAMFDRSGQLVVPPTHVLDFAYGFVVVPTDDGRFVAIANASDAMFAHEVTPQGFGPRMTIKRFGSSLPELRPRHVIAAPLRNGDVLVIWSTAVHQSGDMKSVVLRRDGTVGPESLLATTTNTTVMPLEVLRSEGGYVLAYTSSGNGEVRDGIWSMRLDATGAPASEPLHLASGFNPGALPISPATSPGTLLVPYGNAFHEHRGVYTLAIGAAGQARPPELLSIRETKQHQPVLGAGSGQALAVWNEQAGTSMTVRATSVTANGEPRPAVQLAPTSLVARETGWNGAHHLLLHRDAARLLATRVAADGAIADPAPIVLADVPQFELIDAALVWAGTRWLVVWTNGSQSWSINVTSDGTPSAVRTLDVHVPLPENWDRGISQPALAYDEKHVLLVWSEWQRESCSGLCASPPAHTYAARLTRTGTPVDPLPLDLDVVDAPSLSVASSATEFMVLAGRHARQLRNGAVLRVENARELFDWHVTSDVVWDGTSYVVAFRYHSWYTNWYLGVLRLDRSAQDAGVRRVTPTLTPDYEDAPSIAAPFAGYALIGVHEGTPADGISAVIYRERDLVSLLWGPGPPRNLHVRTVAQFSYEVSWDPSEWGDPDAYIVELLYRDQWIVVGRVPAGVHQATVFAYDANPVFRVRAFGSGGPSLPLEHQFGNPKRRSVR